MTDKIDQYIAGLVEQSPYWIKALEDEAYQDNIPIMEPVGIAFLQQLIRIKQPKKILEIGTAIGYSALQMLHAFTETKVITIERDLKRYQQAKKHINALANEGEIELVFGDALELDARVIAQAPYDLLFIDAAKGQYQRFFELYAPLLSKDAVIVSDNVLFKGYVADPTGANKRTEKIANKIAGYNKWLVEQNDYHTIIIPIGDGIAITTKRR